MDFSKRFWRFVGTFWDVAALNLALETSFVFGALQILSLKDEQLERCGAEVIRQPTVKSPKCMAKWWVSEHPQLINLCLRTTAGWGFWTRGFFELPIGILLQTTVTTGDFMWGEVGGFAWAMELESSNGASGAVLSMDLLLVSKFGCRDPMLSYIFTGKYFFTDLW